MDSHSNNTSSLKEKTITKKGKRQYANPQSTLFNHPTRIKILNQLNDGKKTTSELEKLTGENRVNLYHHLNLLENEKLISSLTQNRQKFYVLKQSQNNDEQKLNTVIYTFHSKENDNIKNELLQIIQKFTQNDQMLNSSILFNNKEIKRIILEFDDEFQQNS